jgi:hypothetical protein
MSAGFKLNFFEYPKKYKSYVHDGAIAFGSTNESSSALNAGQTPLTEDWIVDSLTHYR